MTHSTTNAAVRNFGLATYLRSTAPVLAILPLWWVVDQGVPLGLYLALMALSSIVGLALDVPTSLLADRFHPKRFVQLGTLFFSFSFISTLLVPGVAGFGAYLAFNALASAFLSGADAALLYQLAGQPRFGESQSAISRNTYFLTMGIIPLGALLYTWEPRVAIALQAATLISSLLVVSTIPAGGVDRDNSDGGGRSSPISTQVRSAIPPHRRHLIAVLALLFAAGSIEAVVNFNNRTFQLQAMPDVDSFDGIALWFVVGGLVLGNLLSGYGAAIAKKLFAVGYVFRTLLVVFVAALLVSIGMMNLPYVALALTAYLLVAVVKGVARPVTLAAFANLKPGGAGSAFWFTLLSLATVGLGAAVTWLGVALVGDSLPGLNAVYAALLLIALLAVLFGFPSRPIILEGTESETSGKISYNVIPVAAGMPRSIIQRYPTEMVAADTREIARRAKECTLKSPEILHIEDAALHWEWISGVRLREVSASECLIICYDISRAIVDFPHSSGQETLLGPDTLACSCGSALVHGDLHPDNVLVATADEYFVIDWDLSHIGPPLFDALLLFSHPWTPLSTPDRIELVRRVVNGSHSISCPLRAIAPQRIVQEYLAWKISQIDSWPDDVKIKEPLLFAYVAETSKYEVDD